MQNFIIERLQAMGWMVKGDVIHITTAGKDYRYLFEGDIVYHQVWVKGIWTDNDTVTLKDFHDKLRSECNV